MSSGEPTRCTPGLHGRRGLAPWLVSTILLVVAWTVCALQPAQASRLSATDAAALCGFTAEKDYAPNTQRRRLETDLPDVADRAHLCEIDSDAACPRRILVSAVPASSAPDLTRRPAGLPASARAFNPRAPPILQ
jgi:hypothetical protein